MIYIGTNFLMWYNLVSQRKKTIFQNDLEKSDFIMNYASDVLTMKMDEMSEKMDGYKYAMKAGIKTPIGKKTFTGYVRTLPSLAALETVCYDNDTMIDVSLSDNLGVIVEAVAKSLLGKGHAKSVQGSTDLVTGGKRFEIKYLVKGSSSYPSTLDMDTKEDVLIISNLGAFILRNEDIKKAYNQGYFKKGENKLKPTILSSDLLTETAFTKRLTTEWGLNTWN